VKCLHLPPPPRLIINKLANLLNISYVLLIRISIWFLCKNNFDSTGGCRDFPECSPRERTKFLAAKPQERETKNMKKVAYRQQEGNRGENQIEQNKSLIFKQNIK
jgi:hypothetical protein